MEFQEFVGEMSGQRLEFILKLQAIHQLDIVSMYRHPTTSVPQLHFQDLQEEKQQS